MSSIPIYIGSDNLETHLTEQEVIVLGYNIIITDNANNLSDALSGLGRGYSFTDSLNNWSDAAQVDFLIFSLNQTVTINDRIDKPKGNSANTTFPSWVDGVNLVLLPDGPLQVGTNDLNSFNDDFVVLGTGHLVNDDLNNFADAVAIADGFRKEAFDSMFFNIFDEASVRIFANLTISSGDTLNSWLDAVLTNNAGNPIPPLDDTLNLGDGTALRLNHLLSIPETLILTDAANLALGTGISLSDNANNWADAAIVAMVIEGSVSVADAMSMSDAVNTLMNTSLTNYLRRYLNDVVN